MVGRLLALALAVTLGPCWTPALALHSDHCEAVTREVDVNPQADAVISAVLAVRRPAEDGLFACGQPQRESVEVVEAMRWATGRLNGVGRGDDNSSFIPGITFGLRVLDTCGHGSSRDRLLADAYPVLRDGPAPCAQTSASSDPHGRRRPPMALGLADGDTGAPKALLQRYHIPTLELDPVALVPPEERAKALIVLAQQLGWARVAVLYSSADDYSATMFRSVVRLSSDAGVCLLSAGDAASDADAAARRPGAFLRRAFDSLLPSASSPSPPLGVLVLLRPSALGPLLQTLDEEDPEEEARRVKWLFAWPLRGEDLEKMADREVFSVTLSPAAMPEFEAYWQGRRKADLKMGADARWLAEYEMGRRGCKLPGWAGPGISHLPKCHHQQGPPEDHEGPEEALARASSAAAGLHVVQTFAYALKRAWEDKCGNDKGPPSGPCPALVDMQRKEFEETYLRPLEFEHEDLIRGGKLKMSDPSRLAAARMGLVAYRRGLRGEVIPKEVYAYHLEAVEVLDPDFHPEAIPSASEDQQPGGCLRVREGRVEGGSQIGGYKQQKHQQQPLTLIPSPNNVYVAGMFSLRSPGPGQLDCGPEVNMDAVRQVEAFLWAIRRFNERQEQTTTAGPHAPRLGAVLLDTCSSRVRALTLPAGLLSAGGPHILAAVNALPLPDAEASAGVLAALNVSSVATAEASASTDARSHFSLQVEAPLSVVSDSIVRILQYLGWSYVSLVYSEGDLASGAGVRSFREAADAAGICVSLELAVSGRPNGTSTTTSTGGLAGDLVGARAAGARGVVLWTNAEDTREVMRAMSTAHAQGTLRREDVFWLVASPGGEARELFEEFGNAVGGALVFSPLHRPVREFLQHLRRVRPTRRSEGENPWLQPYVKEVLQCSDPSCRRVLEGGRPADSNTVQAVYAIGAAALRARKELCPTSKVTLDGLCPASSKSDRTDVNRAVNAYLRYSTSERADATTSGEEFRLTPGGNGDVPIEILNFRRGPRGRSRSLGNVYYESVGLFQQEQLKTLTNMVAYRDSGDEMQVSTLASQCAKHCQRCRHRSMDRMTTTVAVAQGQSSETFYLAAALGIHEPSPRPLECGGEVSPEGMLQLEALLWAVEQANKNGSLLPPSVRLAVIAMDTCGSAQKTSRDVANLVGEAEVGTAEKGGPGGKSSPSASRMVAFVAGGGTELTKPAVDILAPLGVAVLAPEATGSVLRMRKKHAPYPLRLSPGNAARASALMALLSRLQWTSFSAIFLEDGVEHEDVFRLVEKESRGRGLKMAASAGLPLTEVGDEMGVRATKEALRAVERLRAEGVKAVLLLLPPKEVDLVLSTAREMREKGQMAPGGITWVGLGAEDVFEKHRDQAQGALILQPKVGWVEEFEKHFKDLNVTSNVQNPWFSDFWASIFHCRGAACRSGLYRNLHSYHVKQNPYVVNTINAVFSIAHALESVHRELCPDHLAGLCRAMKDVARVKRRLFEVAPRMVFVGAGLNGVAFTQSGENTHAALEILNVRQVGSAVWGVVSIGSISAPAMNPASSSNWEDVSNDLVHLDVSKAKAYETENSKTKEIPITEVMSQCASCDAQDGHWDETGTKHGMGQKPNFMEIVSNRRFSILAFLPIHEEGANYLHCGAFKSLSVYKTAAAFSFALERINKNTSILPGIKLGALLWDYCSQPARAHDRLFAFLSRNSEAVATPESALAALVIGTSTAESLAPLLQAQGIPQIVGQVEDAEGGHPGSNGGVGDFLRLSVDELTETDALIGVMLELQWEYVVLVHSATPNGVRAAQRMKVRALQNEICVGDVIPVSQGGEEEDMAGTLSALKQLPSATVVVLLLDTPKETTAVLDAVGKQGGLRERFVFLSGRGWGRGLEKGSEQISSGSIVVGEEEWEVPGFEEYFESLLAVNLTRNPSGAPLPHSWTLEARAELPACDHTAGTCSVPLTEHSSLYLSTVKAVSTMATTLHRFLDRDCPHRFDTTSISSCGHRARERLAEEMRGALEEDGLGQLVVWNVQGGEMVRVGGWSRGGLRVDSDKMRFRHGNRHAPTARCGSGPCVRVCAGQMPRFAAKASSLPVRPQPLEGAGTLEGVVCSALTVFCLLLALAALVTQCAGRCCSEGTRLHRRSTAPSFPLNILVLAGVVVLLGANFAFILSPTEVICSTRRSLPGIAYAIIFSGILVEVVDRWRRYSGDKPLKEAVGSCHPFGLLTSALALVLVQVFLAAGWLLLVPSSVQPTADSGDPATWTTGDEEDESPMAPWPLWRCSPPSAFESHLLLSMAYDALLLLATSLLALLVRRQGRRREVFMGAGKKKERRRSNGAGVEGGIVACCAATWLVWLAGIAALFLLPPRRRDLAVVATDLVVAAVALCTLFARDAYSASRKKHKEEAVGITSIPGLNGRFPYPQPIFSISHFKAQHGFAVGVEPAGGGSMEEDPTQVVPSLLYPLDMFSQASPSMEDCEEDELKGLGEDDEDEDMDEGRINETFENSTDPDDEMGDNWSEIPGLMPARITIPDHREPGTNEFMAPEDDGEDPLPRSLMATSVKRADKLDPFSL